MANSNKTGKKILIIGGGPGGYVAAIRAAQLGADVTLIEKEDLGGTCLNVGCIPTKSILHSARLFQEMKEQGSEIGIIADDIRVDFHQVIRHKNKIVKQLTSGVAGLLNLNGVRVLKGSASFLTSKSIAVQKNDGTKEVLQCESIIIAVGSGNAALPIPGVVDNPNCIDSTKALDLKELPKSMAVIGGGVIGLELACAYASFGTKVTVFEAMTAMLPMIDEEISHMGIEALKKIGIEFFAGSLVQKIEDTASGVKITAESHTKAAITMEAEKVLIAVGRRPLTESLNLEVTGIKHDKGRIIVNEMMETNVPGIYAVGDCVYGHAQLAHTASAMGETAAENICGQEHHYAEDTNPAVIYIFPEMASVGLNEAQAKEQNLSYSVGRFPMKANGKALIMNNGQGQVKVLIGKKYREILGVHMIGPGAADLISEGALAIGMEALTQDIIDTIHSHPTVCECIREAVLDAEGRALHIPPRKLS